MSFFSEQKKIIHHHLFCFVLFDFYIVCTVTGYTKHSFIYVNSNQVFCVVLLLVMMIIIMIMLIGIQNHSPFFFLYSIFIIFFVLFVWQQQQKKTLHSIVYDVMVKCVDLKLKKKVNPTNNNNTHTHKNPYFFGTE